MFSDDVLGNAQPESRASAGLFGGVKRFEDVGQDIISHAASGIGEAYADVRPLLPGLDGDDAVPVNGMTGIHQKIQKDLPQFLG